MANQSTSVEELFPIGGSPNSGYKIGRVYLSSFYPTGDNLTITNASTIVQADLQVGGTVIVSNLSGGTAHIVCTGVNGTAALNGIITYK